MNNIAKAYNIIAAIVFYHAVIIMVYQGIHKIHSNSPLDHERFMDAATVGCFAVGSALLIAVLEFLLMGDVEKQ